MTINEAITKLKDLKPTQLGADVLVEWISELEMKIWHENISWHDGAGTAPAAPYDPVADLDTELLIPEPYCAVYLRWMEARIDYYAGDIAKYSNSMTMYNVALSEYTDWFNRHHMPNQTHVKI